MPSPDLETTLLEVVVFFYRQFVGKYSKDDYPEGYKFRILPCLNQKLNLDELNENTIADLAKTLAKRNPTGGTFVNWRELDHFGSWVDAQPKEVANLVKGLFEDKRSVAERISQLRVAAKRFNNDFTCGTPFVGYLMGAFDMRDYAIYKDSSFRSFCDMFDLSIPGKVEEKYQFYLAVGDVIRGFFADRFGEQVSMLKAQDVIYVVTEYPGHPFKVHLQYLFEFSRRLEEFDKDPGMLLKAIAVLPEEYLRDELSKYEDREKVARIRYRILHRILSYEKELTLSEVEKIARDVAQQYDEKILRSWSMFSILFQLYYDFFKDRVRAFLQSMHNTLRNELEDLDLSVTRDKTISDYTWNWNYGSTRCWLAFYPTDMESHREALQFYLNVTGSSVNYGLKPGQDIAEDLPDSTLDLVSETDVHEMEIDDIVARFEELVPKYIEHNSPQKREPESHMAPDGSSSLKVDFDSNIVFEHLHFPFAERLRRQIGTAIKNEKHIILIGPPGTGKSRLASAVCSSFTDDYKMVTATSDWSTYETIGGYQPDKDMNLQFNSGLFLDCFKDPTTGEPRNRWMIVDEINRADIDKAFGALFSVLTGDSIVLSYQTESDRNIVVRPQDRNEDLRDCPQHEYVIPSDWRMLATMNTYDKTSLYEMSYALMRRFAFISVPVPRDIDVELVREYLKCWDIEDNTYAEEANEIWKLVNAYRQFGPAILRDVYQYLLGSGGDAAGAITMYVFPQLEGIREYALRKLLQELSQLPSVKDDELLMSFAEDYFALEQVHEES